MVFRILPGQTVLTFLTKLLQPADFDTFSGSQLKLSNFRIRMVVIFTVITVLLHVHIILE